MKNIIYSNYDLSNAYEEAKQFLMEEYPELCNVEVEDEEGNITYEPSDEAIWEEIYNEDEIIWDDTWADLNRHFGDKTVIAVGNIGTWRGNYDGSKIGSFKDVFNAAIEDCDYIELSDEDGHFYIRSTHHDSSNYLEVRIVTEEGEQKYEDWKYDWNTDKDEAEISEEIFEDYSELPEFWVKNY